MFNAIMRGWYQGKGNKSTRNNLYKDAAIYYEKALKYARKDGNIGAIAITLECLARSHAKLHNKTSAIQYAGQEDGVGPR